MKKLSKKTWVFALAGVLAVGIGVSATMALLNTNTQTMTNDFKGNGVNVAVVETNSTPSKVYENETSSNTNTYSIITSGTEVGKIVRIENKTSDSYPTVDTFVRVRLVPSFVYNEGTEYAGQTVPMDMTGTTTYTFSDPTNWKVKADNGENYYYYIKKLAPGEISTELISGVTYRGSVPANAHFELQVLTEGIAANQKSTDGKSENAAEQAWGVNPLKLS